MNRLSPGPGFDSYVSVMLRINSFNHVELLIVMPYVGITKVQFSKLRARFSTGDIDTLEIKMENLTFILLEQPNYPNRSIVNVVL